MITYIHTPYQKTKKIYSFHKDYQEGKVSLLGTLQVTTQKMEQYQIEIFEGILYEIAEVVSRKESYLESVRSNFEQRIQELNVKLSVFSQKITDVDRFVIHGGIQLFYHDTYLSSFVGPSSLLIFRDKKLAYSVANQSTVSKIDQFSEMIEGDLHDGDKIYLLGFNLETYLEQSDIVKIIKLSSVKKEPFVDKLIEVLEARMDKETIGFIDIIQRSTGQRFTKRKLSDGIEIGSDIFSSLIKKVGIHKKYVGYGLAGLSICLLLFWSFSGFMKDNDKRIIGENGEVLVDFSIEDIQKDIGLFKQYEPGNNLKIEQYNKIMDKLDLLEKNDMWTHDVSLLRSSLQKDYVEGFNIVLLDKTDLLNEPVYSFSQSEKNTLGTVKKIHVREGYHIGGEDGVLIGALNDTARGSLINSAIGQKLETCGPNLLKNGLTCSANDGNLYHIDKSGFTLIDHPEEKLPRAISDLGTWNTSNLYILTNDERYNRDGIYIQRLKNKSGSQSSFGSVLSYTLSEPFTQQYPDAFGSGGVASFSIDGTFLVWSSGSRKLFQLWRDGTSQELSGRELELQGGNEAVSEISHQTRVMTTAESKYVYLFDPVQQDFLVFRSLPYKTIKGGEKEYSLEYFFTIDFQFSDEFTFSDVYVQEGEKSSLYLLSQSDVYKINLHEYLDQYHKKMEEN